ncbi:MAG: hypothetical protein E6H54_19690 [Betaproteobacteria bacterium]|nr:MAG: hypothetical protein E6H54_19690 [Betaproteobacteria bacterium]
MVIVGLLKDAHQARGVIRALDDAGFSGDDIDMSGGLLSQLVARGVPDEEAHAFAEGVRRGGAIVCVRTDDEEEAAEAAELMCAHGALDIEACTSGWKSAGWSGRYEAQPDVPTEHYAARFGEYPSAPGRIYPDPRRRPYSGPERRVRDDPYPGVERRAI